VRSSQGSGDCNEQSATVEGHANTIGNHNQSFTVPVTVHVHTQGESLSAAERELLSLWRSASVAVQHHIYSTAKDACCGSLVDRQRWAR
jgi:hypothetical protein